MSRHTGVLPDSYKSRLRGMSLKEIAAEAALLRSKGRRCGTATALILRWTIHHLVEPGSKNYFLGLYSEAWAAEKARRAEGLSARPEDRPVKGGRCAARRDDRYRLACTH